MDSKHRYRSRGRPAQHAAESLITQQSQNDSVRLYCDLVEPSQELSYTHDLQGKLLSVDPTTARFLGYEVEELLRIPLLELLVPESRDQFKQRLERVQKNGVDGGVMIVLTRTGERRVWEYLNTLRSDKPGSGIVQGVAHDVTERMRAEGELRQSEERYRSLIGAMAEGVVVLDAVGKISMCNPAAERILGLTTGQIMGRTLMDPRWGVIHEDGSPFPVEDMPAMLTLRTGQPQLDVCMGIQQPDGTRVWIIVNSQGIFRTGETVPYSVVTSFVDITERKRAEEALRASEKRYRRFVERNTACVLVNTLDGRILQANDALLRTLGYGSIQEILAHTVSELYVDPNDRAVMVRLLKEKKSLTNYELRFKRKDGSPVSVLANISLAEDDENVIEGTFIDISESKQAQDALSEERTLLRTLIDNLPDCIYVKDVASRFLVANCGVAQLMGAKNPNDLLGRTDFDFFPKEIATAYFHDEQAVMQSGIPLLNREEVSVDPAGNAKWLLTSKVPLRDKDGQVIGIMGIGRDITIRKQAEKELGESEERFAKAFYSSPEGMSISTLSDKRIIEVNDAALRICGYERSELIGRTARELGIWVNPKEVSALLRENGAYGSIRDKKTNILTKSGAVRQVQISTEVIQSRGEPCILVILRDVTEQETLESQLRQAQKMEAVGRLAGGIAHDFNNLLGVILGYSDLLLEGLPPSDPSGKKIEQIHKAGQRAAGLTRQLLAFSRQQVLQPSILDLNKVVTDIDKMLRRMIGEDVEVITLLRSELGRVKADVGQVEQILMNLAVNARDAMPQGGKLTIETANAEVDEAYAQRHMPMKPGSYVFLSVTDTGVGMDANIQSHLFEPFFTTKKLGKGTGLGLSTVYGIVKQSGGFIWVYSEPGRGTTFKVYLPRVEAVPDSSRRAASPSSPHGSETILLVEDAAPLRELTRELLEHCGYAVLDSGDPLEAIRLAQQHVGPIHLLLTDVVMPGMSGPALAERLMAGRPEMKVLLVSGYTDDAIVRHGVEESLTAFLQKPFTRESLARKVRDVLGVAPEKK